MNNFYNTENISSKGRYEDTAVRTVKGEPSHVNVFEAYLIDNYGTKGENVVQNIGSGTINPNTGMREYSLFSSWLEDTLAGNAPGPIDILSDISEWAGGPEIDPARFWDTHFGKHGIVGSLFGKGTEYANINRASEALELGMEGITETAQAAFSPGGYFDKTRDLNINQTLGSQMNFQQTSQNLQKQVGMATSGASGRVQSLQQNQLIQDAMAKTTQLNKDKADLAMSLRNQVNDLLSTYGTAAGEPYERPQELYNELDLSIGGTGG